MMIDYNIFVHNTIYTYSIDQFNLSTLTFEWWFDNSCGRHNTKMGAKFVWVTIGKKFLATISAKKAGKELKSTGMLVR